MTLIEGEKVNNKNVLQINIFVPNKYLSEIPYTSFFLLLDRQLINFVSKLLLKAGKLLE